MSGAVFPCKAIILSLKRGARRSSESADPRSFGMLFGRESVRKAMCMLSVSGQMSVVLLVVFTAIWRRLASV